MDPAATAALLDAFRENYTRLEREIGHALTSGFGDSVVIERLGDELDDYLHSFTSHGGIFSDEEAATIIANIAVLQQEVRNGHRHAVDSSHHGTFHPVTFTHTGGAGRPRAVINAEWLAWASGHRSTSAIARFLSLSRDTVRNALLEHGLAAPEEDPFYRIPCPITSNHSSTAHDPDSAPLADDSMPQRPVTPLTDHPGLDYTTSTPVEEDGEPPPLIYIQRRSYTNPVSQWTDEELDSAITQLRVHYPNEGITMLHGSLFALGHRVSRERIRLSLLRIDPVRQVFERRTIQRRQYSVPGPNSLWHHDGQHGLIRWGIVIHGFIDGYSRLITGLRASNNNRASTVLDLFIEASSVYGVPSRLRGDHGTENLDVAAFMEQFRGIRRGSYIWGRSVHNVRIERLWVDVTKALGAKWSELFTFLELEHGLDINNPNHVWLLHYLFLPEINQELAFFVETWNNHRIGMRGQPNRSPVDMFGFDMLVQGIRGDDLPMEELEVHGVDWEALHDPEVVASQLANNPIAEGASSWIGRVGPPERLNEIAVEEPEASLTSPQVEYLYGQISSLLGFWDKERLIARWTRALAVGSLLNPDF